LSIVHPLGPELSPLPANPSGGAGPKGRSCGISNPKCDISVVKRILSPDSTLWDMPSHIFWPDAILLIDIIMGFRRPEIRVPKKAEWFQNPSHSSWTRGKKPSSRVPPSLGVSSLYPLSILWAIDHSRILFTFYPILRFHQDQAKKRLYPTCII
jgi:hypothetical protein